MDGYEDQEGWVCAYQVPLQCQCQHTHLDVVVVNFRSESTAARLLTALQEDQSWWNTTIGAQFNIDDDILFMMDRTQGAIGIQQTVSTISNRLGTPFPLQALSVLRSKSPSKNIHPAFGHMILVEKRMFQSVRHAFMAGVVSSPAVLIDHVLPQRTRTVSKLAVVLSVATKRVTEPFLVCVQVPDDDNYQVSAPPSHISINILHPPDGHTCEQCQNPSTKLRACGHYSVCDHCHTSINSL